MLIYCNWVIFININYIFNLENIKIAIIIIFFPCFPKTWNGITVLTSTDFFFGQTQEIGILQGAASEEHACN